jgi:TPR repeat protein
VSLPPATILSVPIDEFAAANEELAKDDTEEYYTCCGKYICRGCIYSFFQSGNIGKCPHCKAERRTRLDEENNIKEMMKRVAVNDSRAMCELAQYYYRGRGGLQQDQEKGIELLIRAAELGSSRANSCLGVIYYERGNLKKAKFHYEAAAMAGDEMARCNLATTEYVSGNNERAVKHYKIAALAGQHFAMHRLRQFFENGHVGRDEIDSILTAYNNSCAEMRSESRDAYILASARVILDRT